MLYLSGCVRPELVGTPGVGFMLTPMMGNAIPAAPFAVDTGCFAAPEKFSTAGYIAWLWQRRRHAPRCLFASGPDVVGDAAATWERSAPVLPLIREMGYPAALVAQDGIQDGPIDWDAFDALFVGGTTAWKLSEATYALVREAKARGKWCHQGRVNSLRRLRAAALGGYDSADGTYLAFGPDVNLPKMRRWLDALERQPGLWAVA